ncbi:hypothetical protein H8D36_02480 [archaeon]|nr:hypothetical protein [archaeon]MBL7057206.1 hypothetical protein [Candidatus Woesearchaeota archaeon]
MITLPLADIKAKIKEQSSLSEDEVNQKIKAKLDQLSGLISEEGAAHIIANELGVKLIIPGEKLKLKSILPGMKNIEVTGKVTRKFELREFNTEKRSGKIASFIISDETGFIRVLLWNDQTDKFEEIKEGNIITIKNGYIRENNGRKELHLNESAEMIINPKGVEITVLEETVARKKLSELAEGDDNVEVLATIVQVFDPRFFEVDPNTGKRAIQKEGKFYAGDKEIENIGYAYVMNLFLDDGSDNVRTVLWRNQIQKLLGLTNEEVLKFREDPASFENVKTDLLGTIVKVVGRVKKNDAFERLELIANLIFKDIDPEEEIKKLAAETPKTEPIAITTETEKKPVVEEKTPDTTPQPVVEPIPAVEPEPAPKLPEEESVAEEEIFPDEDTSAVENAVKESDAENDKDVMSIDDLEDINKN